MMIYRWGDSRRYNSYKNFLKCRFGCRVQKLTLDAGFTCPNRDGSVGTGGCTYCLNDAFNPSYCVSSKPILQQLEEGIKFHEKRYRRAPVYLAYFQAYSNTYSSIDNLIHTYKMALQHPLVKGIVVATRPDCIDDSKLNFLKEINKVHFVSIEYGVESTSDKTLKRINRGHSFQQAAEAINKTVECGIFTGAHFIFGLPGENRQFWLKEIDKINALPLNSIKFHQLQIIKGVKMEDEFNKKREDFTVFNIDSYTNFICEYIQMLNPNIVIERFAGEVPPKYLSANSWGNVRYDVVLQNIETQMEIRNIWQGKNFSNVT